MKIFHVSDTHGDFWKPAPPDVDVIVHSGDMMPNRSRGIQTIERTFQRNWIECVAPLLKARIGEDTPFFYVPGNHDYFDPCPALRNVGVMAYNLWVDGPTHEKGVWFEGFPYVPQFFGEWNYELQSGSLAEYFGKVNLDKVDVLVCHAPMYGVLDRNADGTRCGSAVIRNRLMYADRLPKAYLHGHIHEAKGLVDWKGMIVSNAATVTRVIEI